MIRASCATERAIATFRRTVKGSKRKRGLLKKKVREGKGGKIFDYLERGPKLEKAVLMDEKC